MWYHPWYFSAKTVLQPSPYTFFIWDTIPTLFTQYRETSAQILVFGCSHLKSQELLLRSLYAVESWIISHLKVLPAAPAGQVLHNEAVFSAYRRPVLVPASAIPATVAATFTEDREIQIEF